MSYKVSLEEDENGADPLRPTDPKKDPLMSLVRAEINRASVRAVRESLKVAENSRDEILKNTEELATALITRVEKRVRAVSVAKIMSIKINGGEKRKLTHSASPYLPRLLINAKLGINSLLVGPAGCGKTIVAHQVAESLGFEYGQACMTAGASETWLFGRQTPKGFVTGSFAERYEKGGVFLADEMDAADANLMLAINTALANGGMYNPIEGRQVDRHKDFIFIGAANTVGKGGDFVYTGRNRLDGATLDRFVVVFVKYDDKIEMVVCPDEELRTKLQEARKKLLELNSKEIISTRGLEQAYLQKTAGIEMKEIVESLTAGWPKEIVTQTGL